MIGSGTAALVFSVFAGVVVGFQVALTLGAPWGEMAMGGRYPGRLPPKMRVAALVQAVLLAFLVLLVLVRAGLVLGELYEFSLWAIWFVVALCAVSAILNVITPSRKERLLWAPVTIVLTICSIVVARS